MKTISRPVVVTSSVTATASVAAGSWLQAVGRATPAGFFQYVAVAVGTAVLGGFILWYRPRNRYGSTHLAIGVLFGSVVLAAGVLARAGTGAAMPGWVEEVALAWSWLSTAALLPLWVIAIAAFPDARFHRRVWQRATIAIAIAMSILAVTAYLLAPAGEPPPLIQVELPADLVGPLAPPGDPHVLYRLASVCAAVLGSLAPLAAVVVLLGRFREAGPVLRQQIKWLLFGAAVSVTLQAIPVQTLDPGALRSVAQVLVMLAVPLPLVAAAIAVFKYGLWEIDLVISRGLVYTLVSGLLAATFLGIALVAGVSVGGRDPRMVTALGLALLVSFSAQPLRQRLERVVVRVLYGDEPRGLLALARLAATTTPALDVGDLGSRIADGARGALGAAWAGVWLHVVADAAGTLRPLAVAGAESGPTAVVPHSLAAALAAHRGGVAFTQLSPDVVAVLGPLLAAEPTLVAPMTSSGELLGLIACGPRATEASGDDDLELLTIVARESALALRNIRLEEELRQRLDQISRQAQDLHRSRQRLVTAQDQERRRIERDLHDGAQQQLVALAARLRRASRGGASDSESTLEDLADDAEEAVFTLQELARGIYPSLLADRGLPAALRAHAARLPADVRVEVDPRMHGRRLERQLEAALYFVGLEAMTNAVKHAPGARILISLRIGEPKRTVILEVHDDGPGFDVDASPSDSGLQNMADRIDALGGTFTVQSASGGGTWVRAEVEETADVRALKAREAIP